MYKINTVIEKDGIIACTYDKNLYKLATRINDAICAEDTLESKVIRVNRPAI